MTTADASDPPAGAVAAEAALPLLAAAGFGSMAAMRICDAMLPALGEGFGVATAAASATVSAFAVAYGVAQLLAGPLGDRFGKPRMIGAAAFACAIAAFAAATAPTLTALVAGRALMGAAAAGVIPLTMAWIGDQVPWERRQVVLARLLGYTVGGMMVGAWAGGAIAEAVGWRWAFVAVGALLLAAALGILARTRRDGPDAARADGRYGARVRAVVASAAARRLYAVTFAEGALVFGVTAFVPSLLHDRFGLSLGSAGGVLAVFGLGGVAYARSAPWLLRRVPMAALPVAGGSLLGVAFVVLAAMGHAAWAVPACFLAGVGYYLMHGTLQTCATQLSTTARGTAVSLFACVLFLGQSVGVSAMAAGVARGWAVPALLLASAGLVAVGLTAAAGVRAGWWGRG